MKVKKRVFESVITVSPPVKRFRQVMLEAEGERCWFSLPPIPRTIVRGLPGVTAEVKEGGG